MSKRSAARGTAAARSIRVTLRTSNPAATSNASPSRCLLFCDGSRAARSAGTAAATVSIPPIPKAPPKRRSLRPHQPFRPQEFLMGGKGGALTAGVFTNDQAHAIEFLQAREAKLPDSARLCSGRCGETLNSRQLSLSGENGVKKKLPR